MFDEADPEGDAPSEDELDSPILEEDEDELEQEQEVVAEEVEQEQEGESR